MAQTDELRAAVKASADRWELAPGDEEWSPRQKADHALPAPPMDRVEDVMRTAGSHLRDHARQIADGQPS